VLGPLLRPDHLINRQLAERNAIELLTRHTSSVIPGKTDFAPAYAGTGCVSHLEVA
jgi:hypothetical protein